MPSPFAGLWDVARLFAAPSFEWAGDGEVGVRPLFYEGERYQGRPSRIFSYLGIPDRPAPAAPEERSLPGMVLVHGGGGTAFREWVALWNARGYAAIAMDLGGCQADRRPLPDGGPPQSEDAKFAHPVDGWDDHWVRHAVAAVIRAHSLLRSLPGVDPHRIGLTGISWGGYLTCLVSALDARFRCAIPVYGCGFLQDNSIWLERDSFASLDSVGRRAWHERCDPSQYVPHATMPLLFVTRPTDVHYRLDSLQKTYSLVPPHLLHLAVRVGLGHSHPHGWSPPEIYRFANHHFRSAAALPHASMPTLSTDRQSIHTQVIHTLGLTHTTLAFTTDTGPWQDRTWRHIPARLDGPRTLSASLPPSATACFFTLADTAGGYASSPHLTLHP